MAARRCRFFERSDFEMAGNGPHAKFWFMKNSISNSGIGQTPQHRPPASHARLLNLAAVPAANLIPNGIEERRSSTGRIQSSVVATRKCRINCNETLSPPYGLSNGCYTGAAGEIVDAWRSGFSFLCPGGGGR